MTTEQAKREQAARIVVEIGKALVEAVKEGGEQGVPGGLLYAAVMQHGMELSTFEAYMGALVDIGQLEKRGQLYFAKEAPWNRK